VTHRILAEVLLRLDDPEARFVFPSEVAATSILVAALAESGRKALPARRFIGWDAFKAEVFAGDHRGRPSSKAIRSIFALMLAQENARTPFLSSIVPRTAAAASARFAQSIASALPALRSVPDGSSAHLSDWREIRHRYELFLTDHGLYEAAWLGREAARADKRWVLFHPDLTEDWDDYAAATHALPGATILLSDTPGTGPVLAARFGTIVEEVRAVLLSIRSRVDAGADPAGIMISVAAPESALPILEREAKVAGVPLDAREGKPLSESSGGRLVADIVALSRGRMSFEALRRLLLDQSRPWKEKSAARRLLDIGIRKHVVAPLPAGERTDVWEASIGTDDGAMRLYRGLRTASLRIAKAKGFHSLRSSFDAFKRGFLDETAWTSLQNDEIARCLAVLDELEEAALAAGLPADTVPGAADAYLAQLKETRYLPVSDSGGIAVYRFPVAAGALPDLHYVLNLAQGAAVAAARPLSFMRADERDKLGACDRDISSGLIRLLAESGKQVFLSHSEDGPDGVRPPHPAITAAPPASTGLHYERDQWLPNLEAGARQVPEAFPAQAMSAGAAAVTVFGQTRADWSNGTPLNPAAMGATAQTAVRQALIHDELLCLSTTVMQEYRTCAFKRIFFRRLKVEAVDTGLTFIDNLLLGQLYHEAFGRLFEPLAREGRSIVAPGESEDAPAGETARPGQTDIENALAAAMEAIGYDRGPMAGILVDTAGPVLRRNFLRAAANLLRVLDGQVPVMADNTDLTAPLKTPGTRLTGRPDLICIASNDEDGKRAVIVDYKKSRIPGRKELEPNDDGSVSAIQIPAYTVLTEHAGYEPESAYYLSIEGSTEDGKGLLLVFGPGPRPAIPAEKICLLRPALESAAAATAGIIRRGEVFVPAMRDRDETCTNCDLRPVCRAHYAVR
jgi:hypothetical protein